MTTLEKTYNPQHIEKEWYQFWENNHYFMPQGKGEPYCIMLPPPNVTGTLHMGHGFGFTLMDVLIRYHRMRGDNTLWQPGTDHAGIATQMVVERNLSLEGTTRQSLGREQFVEKIWAWKQESGSRISQQLRRLGASLAWEREVFTMDANLSYAVREVFIRLYEEGLIYKGKRLVNWDPRLATAISDLEVLNEEEEGKLWYIRYPLAESHHYVVIATTRPETLLGDVALAVHPDDERYKNMIGQKAKLPLTEKLVPIIADAYVDPLFGTGVVKITPAHDFNDYAVGLRHHLEPINIFTKDAHLNENVPLPYQGLERYEARKKIVQDLTALGLIEKIEKHISKIPRGERSGVVVEPYLTHQWFLKTKALSSPAIEAVEKGHIRFIPENWSKTYFQWMNNIEDWCISRQLWWGHRIPIWYDDQGKSYAGHDEDDVRKRYQLSSDITLTQDEDVLDTWFSAALWPFASLGWPYKTPEMKTFFPTQVLVTGFDIIFFWVARMIMMSLKFTKHIPFKEVYLTGLIRDADGQKMSKSKGNVLDPIDLIDGISLDALIKKRIYGLMQPGMAKKTEASTRKEFPQGIPSFGTDALRFTFCSFASYTREIRFDIHRLTGYRNFCNKLWNATRYVIMNVEGTLRDGALRAPPQDKRFDSDHSSLSLYDQWILSRLQKTIYAAHTHIAQYRFDLFAQAMYDFTWNEFCDWYLELSKSVLNSDKPTPAMLQGTRQTLINVLEILLRLLHPIIPFITEALWQRIAPLANKKETSTIMLASYPEANAALINEEAEHELTWMQNVVVAIRTIRSEMNVSPQKLIPLHLRQGSESDKNYLSRHQQIVMNLAKLASIQWLSKDETPPLSATAFVAELEIFIPMSGLINKQEEAQRLSKEIEKLQKELDRVQAKLQNPQFFSKAPQAIIEKEKTRQVELKSTLEKLSEQCRQLSE